MSILTPGKQPL